MAMSNPCGNVKHGGCGTLTYARWKSMMQRCTNPNADNFKHYGGRGITVCERWQDFASFLTDMGACPDKSMTLDRIKGELGYEPGNCRWATKADQNRNRPRAAVMLTHAGYTLSATEWAARMGMPATTLFARLRLGWTAEQAITQPVKSRS
jgi:hypothetical protein